MVFATPGICQGAAPQSWREHRFGLAPPRWAALAGKVFWIMGAGTGFGQAIAVALALAGSRVFLSGRRAAKLAETRDMATTFGAAADRCVPLPSDATDELQLIAAASEIGSGAGRLHGLVYCSALPSSGFAWPLQQLPLARWDAMMRTNVTGAWLAARAAIPLMLRSGGARLVLLSSEAGWAGTPGFGPYNISKAALNSLGMSLAEEYAFSHPDADIQVNVLVPGEARTEMNQGSIDSPFTAVPMTLLLLSQPKGGPNGCFFHRDGRHLAFGHKPPYCRPLDPDRLADTASGGYQSLSGLDI